ncbi:MAG: spore cortex-lytic enzyme [Clostridia bacterium]|nr:spore cortex-lytic enzyme [Clostridia bacterium]
MNKRKYIFLGIIVFSIAIIVFTFLGKTYALSKYGSTGSEVKEIQTKLKRWGYYDGSVDGIYGSRTVAAVKKFQKKNGLTVDGIVGPKTLTALGIKTSSSSNSGNTSSSNSSNLNLLSRLVYSEARGEPYKGQVAVAAVVLNRVANSSFPNTISGVIYQSGAFDVVSDGQINMSPDSTAIKAAQDALNGWDPTSGCIYYFNPKTATSKWIWSRPQVLTIGNHIFCK